MKILDAIEKLLLAVAIFSTAFHLKNQIEEFKQLKQEVEVLEKNTQDLVIELELMNLKKCF